MSSSWMRPAESMQPDGADVKHDLTVRAEARGTGQSAGLNLGFGSEKGAPNRRGYTIGDRYLPTPGIRKLLSDRQELHPKFQPIGASPD